MEQRHRNSKAPDFGESSSVLYPSNPSYPPLTGSSP